MCINENKESLAAFPNYSLVNTATPLSVLFSLFSLKYIGYLSTNLTIFVHRLMPYYNCKTHDSFFPKRLGVLTLLSKFFHLFFIFVLVCIFCGYFSGDVYAINQEITIQGKLTDDDGTNLLTADASCVVGGADTCDFQVSMYDAASGGNLVWQQSFSNIELGDNGGVFSLTLDLTSNYQPTYDNSIFQNAVYFVINFDSDGDGGFDDGENFPNSGRSSFDAVPYAFHAITAETLSGTGADGFVQIAPSSTQTTGDVTSSIISINEDGTGTPDLLDLQVAGSSEFNIDNSGNTTINGDLNVDSNTFVVDSTNNRIGIGGVSNPTVGLDYFGEKVLFTLDQEVGDAFQIYGESAGGNLFNITTEDFDILFDQDDVGFNVGIKTNNPSAALDVVGTTELNGTVTIGTLGAYLNYQPNGTECGNGEILEWDATNDRWECAVDDGGGSVTNGVSTNQTLRWNGSSWVPTSSLTNDDTNTVITGDLTVDTNALFVNSTNGRVGIGTASPGVDFDSYGGKARFRVTSEGSEAFLINDGANDIDIFNIDTDNRYILFDETAEGFAVGIGTASPSASFDVVGASEFNGTVTIDTLGAYLNYQPNGSECTSGQILEWNATNNRWECGDDDSGSGNVNDGSVTNQTLRWNGSTWVASSSLTNDGTDTTVTGVLGMTSVGAYFDYRPNGSECGNGQILDWDSTNNRWECATDQTNDSVSGGELDGVFSTTGILVRTGGSTYSTITNNSSNWNTAFGWGNHASQGYLTTVDWGDINNGSGIYMDYRPNNSECGDGQILDWDATNNRWECAAKPAGSNVNDGSSTNQTLRWNGSTWVASSDLQVSTSAITMTEDLILDTGGAYFNYHPNGTECGNGEILEWDSSNDQWECGTDDSSSGVSGSGSATQIAFWTGTSSLGSSTNLYWDNSNNRLGINDSTPTYDLDVNGVGRFTSDLRIDDCLVFSDTDSGTGGSQVVELCNTDPNYPATGIELRSISNPSSGNPIFSVLSSGGAERLRVEHDGAVYLNNVLEVAGTGDSYIAGELALGTSSAASYVLDVTGTARVTSDLQVDGVGLGASLFVDASADTIYMQDVNIGGGAVTIDATTGDISSPVLYTSNSLDAVGINDSTPSYSLDVSGTGRFTGQLNLDGNLYFPNSADTIYAGGAYVYVNDNLRLASAGVIDDDGTFDTTTGNAPDDWIQLNGYIHMKSSNSNHGIVLRDDNTANYLSITHNNGTALFADNNTSANWFMRGDGRNLEVADDLTANGVGLNATFFVDASADTVYMQDVNIGGSAVTIDSNTGNITTGGNIGASDDLSAGGTDFFVDASADVSYFGVQDTTNEGGQYILTGAGSHVDWNVDTRAGEVRWFHSGNVRMRLTQSGQLFLDNSTIGSPADIAERFDYSESVDPGDLVTVDGATAAFDMRKTIGSDNVVFGVITTKAGFILGDESEELFYVNDDGETLPGGINPDKRPAMAIAGRVPVKVNTEGGVINPGDRITISNVSGVGKKWSGSGPTVGIAMEYYDGTIQKTTEVMEVESTLTPGEDIVPQVLPAGVGKIMVLINLDMVMPVDSTPINVDLSDIENDIANLQGGLNNANSALSNINQDFEGYLATADIAGLLNNSNLEIDNLVVKKEAEFQGQVVFKSTVVFNEDSLGQALIVAGDTEVNVEFADTYQFNPIVNLTVRGESVLNEDFNYVITNKTRNGFTIKLNGPLSENIEFDWIALAVEGGNVFISDDSKENIDNFDITDYEDNSVQNSNGGNSNPSPTPSLTPEPTPTPAQTGSGSELT